MKRTTVIYYRPEICDVCGGVIHINDGCVSWDIYDEHGNIQRFGHAHPHCDNPADDNFTVLPCQTVIMRNVDDDQHGPAPGSNYRGD